MGAVDLSLPQGTHTVVLGLGDLNGIMRGKRIPAERWEGICTDGNAFSLALFTMDMTCDVWDTPFASFENGYPDFHMFPMTAPRPVPWEPGVALSFGRAEGMDHGPLPVDPRQALVRQVDRAHAMGIDVQVGTELEFYLLDPEDLTPKDRGIEVYGLDRAAELEHVLGPIRRELTAFGIPIEQSNPEYAAGQVEVNIRYGSALEAADQVVMFRSLVKQIAAQHGYRATFMAKPFVDQSGNGFHAHYSLWRDGKNIFAQDGRLSATGHHFVGGLQKRMGEAAVCGSGTVNGFRRRRPMTFCPVNATWGIDNRTCALRVIEGADSAVRVEKRDAGADCNPYFLLATDIAAGLDGITEEMDPSPMTVGNAYAEKDAVPLPTDLGDALEKARASGWLSEVLGDVQCEIYLQQCARELRFYEEDRAATITDLERSRYLRSF